MYDINAGNARPEMAEVGKGSNQLADYRPVERAIEADAAMQERKAIKKDEEAKARQKELMDKLAQMQGKAIMSHDTTGIAEQQQDLKDTVMKNIDAINKGGAGAVEAELAVNQKIATLNQNINSSVAKRQSVEALAKDMQANPNRYTKKSRKNVEDFIINGGMVKNPDGTWAVNPYDETQLAEPSTDLQAELKATRDALRETSPKIKKGYTLPDGTGTYVESETYNTSLEDVKDDKGNIIQPGVHSTLRQMYADNERVRNKAHELFEDESDDVKKQYTDPTTGEVDAAKYFAEKFASQVGHTETSRTSRTPQGKGEGETGADAIDNTPSTYKMTTPNTAGISVDATATSIANGRLGKNISKNLTLTTDIRDINGNILPFAKGVYPTSGSDVKVVPVYKKGAKGVSGDLSGSIIPDGRIDNAIKAGVIEYQPIFMGKMTVPDIDEETGEQKTYINTSGAEVPLTKEISITAPARLLKGGLGKSEKTFDELNRIAEEKNATIKGAPQTTAPKAAGKAIKSDATQIKSWDKAQSYQVGNSIYYFDGTKWNKK